MPSTDPRRDGPLPYGGSCEALTGDATWDTVPPHSVFDWLLVNGAGMFTYACKMYLPVISIWYQYCRYFQR